MAKIKRGWFVNKKVIAIAAVIIIVLWILHWKEKTAHLVPPDVTVVKVEKKTVPVHLNYVGNTASVRNVDIRARVEGFLVDRSFVEGDDVRENDLMFVIDPRPFEAALDEAKGRLAKDEAARAFADEQVERYRGLVEKEFISREDFDDMVTTAEKAAAAVVSDMAAVVQAELNLSYCRMYAPFDGRIGRTLVHVGNLVGAGQDTKLATIVQLDPIYAYFSPSADDVHRILKEKQKGALPVNLSFTDGTKYPHSGKVDFVDNVVDTSTSTVAMRAVIPNPEKTLLPGVYVNVQLHLKDMPGALLVPEKSLGEDQGGLYVMLVGPGDTVGKNYVKTGEPIEGMRVITDGVKDGDVVITEGLQIVRPGMDVNPVFAEKKAETVQEVIKKAVFN